MASTVAPQSTNAAAGYHRQRRQLIEPLVEPGHRGSVTGKLWLMPSETVGPLDDATQANDDPWANPNVPLGNNPEFQELLERHEVDRALVIRLLRLVTERHYGSTATDTSLREDVESELKRAEQQAQ